jgi:hypothetical protein
MPIGILFIYLSITSLKSLALCFALVSRYENKPWVISLTAASP